MLSLTPTRRLFLTTTLLAAPAPAAILELVNQTRVRHKLRPLLTDKRLTAAARVRATAMARRGYFSHTSPEGRTPWDDIKESGFAYSEAAENLAQNWRSSQEVHDRWMKSAPHRANILNPRLTYTGIGVDGEIVVQLFAAPQ